MNVWRMTATGGDVAQITAGQGDDVEIDLSADGKRMVFSSYRANINLAEMSLDARSGPPLKWLTSTAAQAESAPRYSPDGQRIAYFSTRDGAERESIWVTGADGTKPTRLVEDANTNIYPRWTVDGQELVFYSRTPGPRPQADLRRVALAGGAPESLPIKPWFPTWGWGDVRADGRLLYRISERAGESSGSPGRARVTCSSFRASPI